MPDLGFKIKQEMRHTDQKKVASLSLYGRIGDDEDIDPAAVVGAISDLEVDVLEVYMNSVGGNPFSGFAIGNRMQKLKDEGSVKEIQTFAEGIVGSAATIPFLRGDKRTMLNGSRFFIHKASGVLPVYGTVDTLPSKEEMEVTYSNFLADLETTNDQAADLYAEVSNLSKAAVTKAMAATTTYGPSEAVAAGFATHTDKTFAIAACLTQSQALKACPGLPDSVLELFPDEQKLAEEQRQRDELAAKINPINWSSTMHIDTP